MIFHLSRRQDCAVESRTVAVFSIRLCRVCQGNVGILYSAIDGQELCQHGNIELVRASFGGVKQLPATIDPLVALSTGVPIDIKPVVILPPKNPTVITPVLLIAHSFDATREGVNYDITHGRTLGFTGGMLNKRLDCVWPHWVSWGN